jgi:broad specificity phosphatase PhoE
VNQAAASLKAGSDQESAFAVPGRIPEDAQLWLIRHGETEWSKSGQHTGRTDLPLTAEGEAQARTLRELLARVRPAYVISSPRQRALDTARIAGLKVDAVDEDLAEWDYGDYEGLTTVQIRESVPGWTVWTHPSPNGETIDEVGARAERVLTRALERLRDGPVVLISHGHISRVIGARWIGLHASYGSRLALDTAAPSLFGAQHGIPVIDRWNMLIPAASEGNAR